MASGSGGLNPSAVAGGPSVTRLTHSRCRGVSGSGNPSRVAKKIVAISPMLHDIRKQMKAYSSRRQMGVGGEGERGEGVEWLECGVGKTETKNRIKWRCGATHQKVCIFAPLCISTNVYPMVAHQPPPHGGLDLRAAASTRLLAAMLCQRTLTSNPPTHRTTVLLQLPGRTVSGAHRQFTTSNHRGGCPLCLLYCPAFCFVCFACFAPAGNTF